ncbi:hypothetical protein SUGI_0842970 [Cryptomeria japonica]|nr:hypothetical protein SUGI_0842970 [Cryptomeria japonica]
MSSKLGAWPLSAPANPHPVDRPRRPPLQIRAHIQSKLSQYLGSEKTCPITEDRINKRKRTAFPGQMTAIRFSLIEVPNLIRTKTLIAIWSHFYCTKTLNQLGFPILHCTRQNTELKRSRSGCPPYHSNQHKTLRRQFVKAKQS